MRQAVANPSVTHQDKSAPPPKWHIDPPLKTLESHPILRMQQTTGNQAVQRMLSASLVRGSASRKIQPKLSISAPGDAYEQEADRVADTIMRMPDPGAHITAAASSQVVQRMCPECDEEEKLHRKASGAEDLHAGTALESEIAGLSGGQPLSLAERAFFEPRFGRDFSSVRVHTGPQAARLADSVSAHAFTLGNNVVFNSGKYSPESEQGKHLLAHELTHVVQQNGIARAVQRQSADEYTFGEIGSWGVVSLTDFSAPAGLADAKASIGAVCRPNTCRHVSGAAATAPGDQHSWQNIVAANGGSDQSGGGTLMCVGTQQCGFVHQCTRCNGTNRETVERTAAGGANLSATGTVNVAGHGTLYFYSDPLQGWCNSADRQSGCHPRPAPHHGSGRR
jgi:uncharacterized protein DUF4157